MMGLGEQFSKIKDNWLLLVVVLVILVVVSGGGSSLTRSLGKSAQMMDYGMADESFAASRSYAPSPIYGGDDFAPEVEERVITKTASMSTEVERGTFQQAETQLKSIMTTSDSFILSENVNKYDNERRSYYRGYYQIKVETQKYAAIVGQLKEIGEVESFSESTRDITGQYVRTEDRLVTEEARLERFETMFEEAKDVSDKIELTDRIFNLERTISYYENQIAGLDRRVDYSTISFTMTEKRSDYANVVWVKFSDLIRSLVNSFNNLMKFLVVILPWVAAFFVIWLVYRLIRYMRQ